MSRHPFILVWRYVCFHWGKSLILLFSFTLAFSVPMCLGKLIRTFENNVRARAVHTPLLLGAKGNEYDLTLHALYFRTGIRESFPASTWHALMAEQHGRAAPFTHGFTARSRPIIGTTLEYFEARSLELATGSMFLRLGQCVIGSDVASDLGLQPGDALMSDPDNVFNLAGDYPLKMQVTGVLARTGTPDDGAVFVDLKTHWILEGYGHGHEKVEGMEAEDGKVLQRTDREVTASAAVTPYLEFNANNQEDFHFHAAMDSLPITAVLIWPDDAKATALMLGDYNHRPGPLHLIRPLEVVESMMEWVFRVKSFMDANFILIGLTVIGMASMVLILSLRLRREEFETFHCLGCRRTLVLRLVLIEWGWFILAGLLIAQGISSLASYWIPWILSPA